MGSARGYGFRADRVDEIRRIDYNRMRRKNRHGKEGHARLIYLDYAADTPPCEAALNAFTQTALRYGANPNAEHAAGRAARQRLAEATAGVATLLGVEPDEVVFTSGATEANNLAILGLAHAYRSRGQHVIVSPMEHASVTGPMMALKADGFTVELMRMLPDGRVDMEHFKGLLRRDTVLVSLCAADSEVGVLQPLQAVRDAMRVYPDCRLHVDATQTVGKLPIDLTCADLLTCSPHKFYGLTGSGVLAVRGGLRLTPLWHGGAGATPYRSGTPALALAAATEAALREALQALPERLAAVRALNRTLRAELAALPFATLNSPEDASPYVINFSVTGFKARELLPMLSEQGVCVSSKSACCAPAAPSHPVLAMTGDRKRAMNTVRVSLSHLTTAEEIAETIRILRDCARRLEESRGYMPADRA